MNTAKKVLTSGDVATHCQVSYETVSNWIKNGKLKSYQTPGRHRRIRIEDFMDFLTEHGMPPLAETTSEIDPDQQRILIVDDEPAILELITHSFKIRYPNHALCTAADGFEAGLQVVKFRPNLIILDLMMPNINGFRICHFVRSNPETQHIGVMVVTGYADEKNVERIMESGADQWMAKPFDPNQLIDQAETVLAASIKRAKESTPAS